MDHHCNVKLYCHCEFLYSKKPTNHKMFTNVNLPSEELQKSPTCSSKSDYQLFYVFNKYTLIYVLNYSKQPHTNCNILININLLHKIRKASSADVTCGVQL